MLGPGTARVKIRVVGKAKAGRSQRWEAKHQTGRFVVQLGAFRQGHRAEALADRARTARAEVVVRYDGSLFRVEVGPFDKRKKAEQAASELDRRGFETVVRTAG